MHLLLRCFAFAFACSLTATANTLNPGLRLAPYPEPTPVSHGVYDVIRARDTDVSNPTCGWVDGSKANPVTCEPQYICGTTKASIVGCCKTTTGSLICADIVTACYDFLGGSCDTACQVNLNNLICDSRGYGCGPRTRYTATVALTVKTNTGGGTLTDVATADASTSSHSASPTSPPSTSVITSPSPSLSEFPHPSTSLTTGAIAGISVGSAAGVALIAFIIYWVWTKRRRPHTRNVHQSSVAGEMPGSVGDSEMTYELSPNRTEIHGFPSPGSPGYQPPWGHLAQQRPYTGPTIPEME